MMVNFVIGNSYNVQLYPGHTIVESKYLGNNERHEVFSTLEGESGNFLIDKKYCEIIEGIITHRNHRNSPRIVFAPMELIETNGGFN